MRIPFILTLCLFTTFALAQKGGDPVKSFIQSYEDLEEAENRSLGGWLIRLGTDTKEEPEMKAWLKKIRHLDMLSIPKAGHDLTPNFKGLSRQLLAQNFEPYIMVRDKKNRFEVLVLQESDLIKQIVVLSDDDDNLSVIRLKTRLKLNDMDRLDAFLEETM